MTALYSTIQTQDSIHAKVKCDDGDTASLYFIAGDAGPEVALVGIPSKVARDAAAAFNDAMAQAEAPRLEDVA